MFAFCTQKNSPSHKLFIFIHYDDIRLMFSAPLFSPFLLHLSLTINEKHEGGSESEIWKWTKCVLLKLLPFRLIYSHGCSWGKEFNKKYSCCCYSLCAFFVLFLLFHFIVQMREGKTSVELAWGFTFAGYLKSIEKFWNFL